MNHQRLTAAILAGVEPSAIATKMNSAAAELAPSQQQLAALLDRTADQVAAGQRRAATARALETLEGDQLRALLSPENGLHAAATFWEAIDLRVTFDPIAQTIRMSCDIGALTWALSPDAHPEDWGGCNAGVRGGT